jgi:hypothetical protein
MKRAIGPRKREDLRVSRHIFQCLAKTFQVETQRMPMPDLLPQMVVRLIS